MKPVLHCAAILCSVFPAHPSPGEENKAGTWPVDRLKSEVPAFSIEDRDKPIQSILYAGEPVDGKPTEVFAFYASPKTLGTLEEGQKVPGIVLIHGGGGTAFSDWVHFWAQRGYAAIAMDLSGRRPPAPSYDDRGKYLPNANHPRAERVRLEKGGLDHTNVEKFKNFGGIRDDDWPFHAVANVMKAHTLLRNFAEVDPDKIAVTGISWGGYTTCIVASIDNRFKAAVPVYGCGFLFEGESVQKPFIDALGDRRDAWIVAYDPSSHLGKCTVPTLWVNGTHDQHYPLDSYAQSYGLVPGSRTLRIEPHMRHGHQAGWEPMEIGIYVDSLLIGGTPLPTVGNMSVTEAGKVTVPYESTTTLTKAELHYTTDEGLRSERKWKTLPATIHGDKVIAGGLPAEANTWIITLTDERGTMVSSEVGFRN